VTYHYRSHRTERTEHETVDVLTFIGRMVQHVVPKGFQRVRYYGVQATKTFAKLKPQWFKGVKPTGRHRFHKFAPIRHLCVVGTPGFRAFRHNVGIFMRG
jgi:hypothetical protein